MKQIDGDNVVLIKTDLSEITVPLAKLSTADKNYVNKFKKSHDQAVNRGEIPAKTPELPEIESFEGSFGSTSIMPANNELQYKPLGKIPGYFAEFEQAGTGFNRIRSFQELVAVIPVGGPDQLVLMTTRERNPFDKYDNFQSQLYWVSLKRKKVINTVAITHEDYAIDYDPRHKLLLSFNRKEEFVNQVDEPDHYTVWKLDPGAADAEPLVRWAGEGMGWASHLFGKIINERVVVTKKSRQTYQAWDIVDKKCLYTLNQMSFFDAPVVVSPDRTHLILPEDGKSDSRRSSDR